MATLEAVRGHVSARGSASLTELSLRDGVLDPSFKVIVTGDGLYPVGKLQMSFLRLGVQAEVSLVDGPESLIHAAFDAAQDLLLLDGCCCSESKTADLVSSMTDLLPGARMVMLSCSLATTHFPPSQEGGVCAVVPRHCDSLQLAMSVMAVRSGVPQRDLPQHLGGGPDLRGDEGPRSDGPRSRCERDRSADVHESLHRQAPDQSGAWGPGGRQ